jgi:hypothetical protein
MSARRAVLLTVLVVLLVIALGLGGYFAYWFNNRYDDAVARAERWKERARVVEAQAADAQSRARLAYTRGYDDGKTEVRNEPWNRVGVTDAGYYVVRFGAPDGFLREVGAEKMAGCRHYWVYSDEYEASGTLGRSIDEPC